MVCGQEELLVIDHHQHHQQKKRQDNCRAQGGFWINPACCAALLSITKGERHTKNRPKKRESPDLDCGGLRKSAIWAPIRGLRGGYPELRDGALGASLDRG